MSRIPSGQDGGDFRRAGQILPAVIVQLECHPFITIGEWDPTREPFGSDPPVLASLAKAGFEVQSLQSTCRARYLAWHRARTLAALNWVATTLPKACPHFRDTRLYPLIVFPEGSIPVDFLPEMCAVARRYELSIVAGTHKYAGEHSYAALPLCNDRGHAHEDRRACAKALHKRIQDSRLYSRSVVPFIFPNGKVFLRGKTHISPHEFTENSGSRIDRGNENESYLVYVPTKDNGPADQSLRVAIHVCSEALQQFGPPPSTDVYVIPSYNASARPFESQLSHVSRAQVPVLYCNDGHYGDSQLALIPHRHGDKWFIREVRALI